MKLTKAFFHEIRELIVGARSTVARGVDLVQVHTNFEIGRRIVEQEQQGEDRAAYGQEILKALASRLTGEFGNGFSRSNLEYMRRFFLLYQDRMLISQSTTGELGSSKKPQSATGKSAIPQTPSVGQRVPTNTEKSEILQSTIAKLSGASVFQSATGKPAADDQPYPTRPFTLSWTHYVVLLGIKNPDERSFYEIEAAEQNWTVRELKRQYDSSLYERLALSRDKKGIRKLAKEGQVVASVHDLLKEPLVLEFLGLDEQARYSESDLETAILNQIERFLLELGKGFLFQARQRRFTFDDEHYFVDLVFYNRLLRCYVLIDLKIGKLTHQDLGQMQMYVNYFDREERMPDEAPTIGIILCKQKNKALVRITLPKDTNIHAREYQLYLPSKQELQRKLVEWAGE
jgi:predicted nuclease of restriction endonuclease-like (RecB) superfamily